MRVTSQNLSPCTARPPGRGVRAAGNDSSTDQSMPGMSTPTRTARPGARESKVFDRFSSTATGPEYSGIVNSFVQYSEQESRPLQGMGRNAGPYFGGEGWAFPVFSS